MNALHEQFTQALHRIEVNGKKQQRAIEAHTEIQGLLAQDPAIARLGNQYATHRLLQPTNSHLPGQRCGRVCAS